MNGPAPASYELPELLDALDVELVEVADALVDDELVDDELVDDELVDDALVDDALVDDALVDDEELAPVPHADMAKTATAAGTIVLPLTARTPALARRRGMWIVLCIAKLPLLIARRRSTPR
jgi:hypothetical protein